MLGNQGHVDAEGILDPAVESETLRVLASHVVGMPASEIVNPGAALQRSGCREIGKSVIGNNTDLEEGVRSLAWMVRGAA